MLFSELESQETVDRFATFITNLRKERGLTKRETESLTGVSYDYIRRIELGELAIPSGKILLRLAQGLGVDPDIMFQEAGLLPGRGKARNKSEEELISYYRKLSGQDKRNVVALTKALYTPRKETTTHERIEETA